MRVQITGAPSGTFSGRVYRVIMLTNGLIAALWVESAGLVVLIAANSSVAALPD